jgi:hypothetical protein
MKLWRRQLSAGEVSVAAGIVGNSLSLFYSIMYTIAPEFTFAHSTAFVPLVFLGELGASIVGVLAALVGFRSRPALSALGLVLALSPWVIVPRLLPLIERM